MEETEVEVINLAQKRGYLSSIYSAFCVVFCLFLSISQMSIPQEVEISKVPDTSVAEKTIEIEDLIVSRDLEGVFRIKDPISVDSPSVDAEENVMKFGEKFLYGHSSLAFSPLKTLEEGSEIELEENGKTEKYIVEKRIVEKKSVLDKNSALRKAIYSAVYRGEKYDLSLMTCGNGKNDDRSMRLILFAKKKDA